MSNSANRKVAFISSYPPRRCGIATFCADLIGHLCGNDSEISPLVVAMQVDKATYTNPVQFEIRTSVKNDYLSAADYMNLAHVELVSVQHEFGLYGGEAGSYLSLLLKRIKAPIVTTLHTVLDDPEPAYFDAMIDLCQLSDRLVTMNHRGVDMLQKIYNINPEKIDLIPHGIPDLPFVDSNYYKAKFGLEGRRTILTFGLLNQNKGIEMMLRALPAIIKADPSVIYVVLGMTHPLVIKNDGESYRFSLQKLVKELNIEDHVIFHNRFVNAEELHNFLCAADIYVTPYQNREQLTSGTLSFAVGAGKAVVSTPYWAAEELLSDERGALVPFGDSNALAEQIIEILRNDTLFYRLRRRAYDYGRSRTWEKIGQLYASLFKRLSASPVNVPGRSLSAKETHLTAQIPEPSLDHLMRMTDDTGLFQHAKFTIPNRAHGYCSDDNTRALIVLSKYYQQYKDRHVLDLFDRYLSFLLHSQKSDGTIRNFMNFDRTWLTSEPQHDGLGRVLWALGTVIAHPPNTSYTSIAKEFFDRTVRHVDSQSPRGMAYSIFGMTDYLKQFPGASDIKRHMLTAADSLLQLYLQFREPTWDWFENILCYDNAVVPDALFRAAMVFESDEYRQAAEQMTAFLLEQIFNGDHFSFIGCNGWYRKNGKRASFDQQPIEPAGTILLTASAYQATGDIQYLHLQRKAFDWFMGSNDLGIPLYDFKTHGCCDALMADGVNLNQGAESTLSFLMGLLAIIESYSFFDAVNPDENEPDTIGGTDLKGQIQIKPFGKSEDSKRSDNIEKKM